MAGIFLGQLYNENRNGSLYDRAVETKLGEWRYQQSKVEESQIDLIRLNGISVLCCQLSTANGVLYKKASIFASNVINRIKACYMGMRIMDSGYWKYAVTYRC